MDTGRIKRRSAATTVDEPLTKQSRVAHFPALCHAVKLTDSERAAVLFVPPNPASVVHREKVNSRFFEIARVLVRFDHVGDFKEW